MTDARGTTAGWEISAASTTFVRTGGGSGTSSTGVSYNAGAVSSTGTVTAESAGTTSLTTVAAVVASGTLASGNNTASYNPTLTVSLPASALAGSYTGTVTTSIL